MRYTELRRRVADQAGYPQDVVQTVLDSFISVLNDLAPGERVPTPLGVFRRFQRKDRLTPPPPGVEDSIRIPGEFIIKLKEGRRLRSPIQ